jgi:hypothetical protein
MCPIPLTTPQKVGIMVWGFLAFTCTAMGASAGCFVIGMGITLAGRRGWVHLGEYQPWLPIIGLEQGLLLGLVVGAIVAGRAVVPVCAEHLQSEAVSTRDALPPYRSLTKFCKKLSKNYCICGKFP